MTEFFFFAVLFSSLGNITEGCASTGTHFNPLNKKHGSPNNGPDARHVGDMGNLEAGHDGVAWVHYDDYLMSLNGPFSIVGRAVVVHAVCRVSFFLISSVC